MRLTWVQPTDLLRHELRQSAAEGRDVRSIADRWAAAGGEVEPPHSGYSEDLGTPAQRKLAHRLLDELDAMPEVGTDEEPSEWPAIQALLTPTEVPTAHGDLDDRLLGAWYGRAVGCLLGKPVEKIPRAGIEEILRATGRWPLDRYFTAQGLPDHVAARWPWNRRSRTTSLEENIEGMPEDDDLNFTLMALRLVEEHGLDFTPTNVARSWLDDLPGGRVFTAERVTYRNLLEGVSPPDTARIRNPFREWIGAMIRADLYGWVVPGQPLRAAELAWRDACVSHTRNGIYGALFVAGMSSAAVCGADVDTVLDAGRSVVPPHSRMAAAIDLGRSIGRSHPHPKEAYPLLEQAFPDMHWVHSLNNAALIAYSLTASRGDFGPAICLAVMGGWDTDSSGATVGAVTGALCGSRELPPYWVDPLRGRLASSIPGCDDSKFTDLADRTRGLVSLP